MGSTRRAPRSKRARAFATAAAAHAAPGGDALAKAKADALARMTEALAPVLPGEPGPFGLSRLRTESNLHLLGEGPHPHGTPEGRERARQVIQQIIDAGLTEGESTEEYLLSRRQASAQAAAPRESEERLRADEAALEAWLSVPDTGRREILAAVLAVGPDPSAMADVFHRMRLSEGWEAFKYGVWIERARALRARR